MISISPQLSVKGGRAALAFYTTAFGARELYRMGGTEDEPEVVAQLAIGLATFWITEESPPHKSFSPESVGGTTVRILLTVDDPAAVVAQAVAQGATETAPVKEEFGWLLGRVEDPFGHHWEIGKPMGTWPPPPDKHPHEQLAHD